jgi:hypothetical protein
MRVMFGKKSSLMVDNAVNVAKGEIIEIPIFVATFYRKAGIKAVQPAPMIALTP